MEDKKIPLKITFKKYNFYNNFWKNKKMVVKKFKNCLNLENCLIFSNFSNLVKGSNFFEPLKVPNMFELFELEPGSFTSLLHNFFSHCFVPET